MRLRHSGYQRSRFLERVCGISESSETKVDKPQPVMRLSNFGLSLTDSLNALTASRSFCSFRYAWPRLNLTSAERLQLQDCRYDRPRQVSPLQTTRPASRGCMPAQFRHVSGTLVGSTFGSIWLGLAARFGARVSATSADSSASARQKPIQPSGFDLLSNGGGSPAVPLNLRSETWKIDLKHSCSQLQSCGAGSARRLRLFAASRRLSARRRSWRCCRRSNR